jgi:large repetitive protein
VATVPSIGRAAPEAVGPGLVAAPAEATRTLYELYGRQIFAYCLVQLRNREDAEDAVQTTFLNAFRGLERGVVPELESAWLYKIAQHVCLTRRRSWSRRRNVESPQDLDSVQEVIGSPMRDTDEAAGLTDALRQLPEQQRRAIVLREWQGLTYKEIAAEMQLSQAAVETLIFRARRGLAQTLERLRGSGDLGSIFAAFKSILVGAGTKVAITVATVATTSVVAATPQARQGLVHFVDAVSNIGAPVTALHHPKPKPVSPPAATARVVAAPAATAAPAVPAAGRHHKRATLPAVPAGTKQMGKKASPEAAATAALTAAPAADAATPPTHPASPSAATSSPPTPTVAQPTVAQPTVAQPTVAQPTVAQPTSAPPTVAQPSDATPTVTTPAPSAPPAKTGSGDGSRTKAATPAPVAVAPTVNGFTPSGGPVGTYVKVGGQSFRGATSVTFNGTSAPFSVSGDGQLSTKVPDGATSGPITVVTPNGSATSGDTFIVTVPAPYVGGFSPSSGAAGTTVQIVGHNFGGATAVRFNGTSADFTANGDVITTHVPSGATSGQVTVVTPNGTATSSGNFTVTVPTPSIYGTSPSSGSVGASVGIGGHNFTGATTVRFNGTSADFTVSSDTLITTHVPSGATSGQVTVVTPNGTATSSGNFTVTVITPAVSGFSPSSGPVGTSVAIGGSNFGGATSVKFNGAAASFTVNSDSTITATVPSGATSGTITVVTPNGTATSSGSFTVAVTTPSIEGLSPSSGATGSTVQIGGHNFTGATSVKFNGASASFTVTSDGLITAQVPSSATSGPVSVTTPNGTATSSASFTVTVPGPSVSGFSPSSGVVGASIGIGGARFTGATSVKFNGVTASFTVTSDGWITAQVPSGATSGPVSVTTPNGTATSSGSFTVTH